MLSRFLYGCSHLLSYASFLRFLKDNRLFVFIYTFLFSHVKKLTERREQLFLKRNLQNGMTVFDIGSHTGNYSALFSHSVGESGHVHCFEPDTWSCNACRTHLHGASNADVHCIALGDREQESVRYYPNKQNRASGSLYRQKGSQACVNVPMMTLDAFCSEQNIRRIDAMKIDTEGCEDAVLKGGTTVIRNSSPKWILCELHPEALNEQGSSGEELFDTLQQLGYQLFTLGPRGKPCPITDDNAFLSEMQKPFVNIVAMPATVS